MAVAINGIEPASPASKAGIVPGEILISIDGHKISDVLDYRFYMTSKTLYLNLINIDGKQYSVKIHKGEYDELGLLFETYLMDKQMHCKNKCVFCFIDQLPKGMRHSLYFKDDDNRLSFLFGNYITLTNLQDEDIDRITTMHISPVNISVHTMNPKLRVEMMGNKNAGNVLRYIPKLISAGIKINAQLVLCPGLNDGEELAFSLSELTKYENNIQSIAVVPIGLTKFRDGLTNLRKFNTDESQAVIDTIDSFGDQMFEKYGQRICFASDEFYINAKRDIPQASFYEEFAQLENGVGMLSLLIDEFTSAIEQTTIGSSKRRITIATGHAALPYISSLATLAMNKIDGLCIQTVAIDNNYFGHTITVAGLVTGGDIISQLKDFDIGDELIFPSNMLRREEDVFLDDITVEQLQISLNTPVKHVINDGWILLDAILGNI